MKQDVKTRVVSFEVMGSGNTIALIASGALHDGTVTLFMEEEICFAIVGRLLGGLDAINPARVSETLLRVLGNSKQGKEN